MDPIKVIIFFTSFFVAFGSTFDRQKMLLLFMTMLGLTDVINALFSSNMFLQLATFSSLVSLAGLAGLIFRNKKGERYERNINTKEFMLFLAFILFNLFHIFFDLLTTNDRSVNFIERVNAFGLVITFTLIFSGTSNAIFKYLNKKNFERFIFCATGLLFMIIICVKLGLISGNTSKVGEGIGGIGLKGHSTNETSLIAVCLSIFLFSFLNNNAKNRNLVFLGLLLNLIVIIFSESRVGLASFAFCTTVFIFKSARKNPIRTFVVSFVVGVLCIPLLSIILEKLSKRISSDTGIETNFALFSDNFGITLSGRTIVWEAYIEQFFRLVERDALVIFTGSGFQELIKMYRQSFLTLIDFSVNRDFFPIHSDVILIFIATGILGLVLWILTIKNVISNLIARPNFVVGCFVWVVVVFSLIDMLNYSFFSSLLIGLGLCLNKKTYMAKT